MRTVTYGGAVSLDGFLAGPDGALDWLHFSTDVVEVMTEFWKGVDTVLMGRKTYEVSAAMGGSKELAVQTYVFSKTLEAIEEQGIELVKSNAIEFVRHLTSQPGKGICLMGGGELARSLIAADLVDEIGFNIHPVLLGKGIPALPDPACRVRLSLTECRTIDGGCILAKYRVLRSG
jgi:dihydrofolate reductase